MKPLKYSFLHSVFVFLFFVLLSGAVHAQVVDTRQVSASDAAIGDNFGTSVSMEGDRAVSGAPGANKAYIYEWDGMQWVEVQILTASDVAPDDQFGHSVFLHNNRVVVGAPEKGAAYVFDWDGTTWSEVAKITPLIAQADSKFGGSVSLYEDRILVGAWGEDVSGEIDQGAAYLFDWDGVQWNETAKLTGEDSNEGDRFGWSVSVYGDRAIIGAPHHTMDGFLHEGGAFLFEWDATTWSQTGQWYNSNGYPGDQFGYSVSMEGNRALIGEPFHNFYGIEGHGIAHLIEWTGTAWTGVAVLVPEDGQEGDNFGHSVALDGELLVIGARGDDVMGVSDAGSAYLFEFQGTGWFERAQVYENNPGDTHYFGSSVAISNRRIFAGVEQGDKVLADITQVDGSGTGYVFQLEDHVEGTALTASDGDVGDNFGYSISLHNDRAIVGAFSDYVNPFLVGGAAYIYEWDGTAWSETQKIGSSIPGRHSYFGLDVAMYGDRALVAARDEDDFVGPTFKAVVYAFEWDGTSWVETEIIDIPEPDDINEWEGEIKHISVSLYGDRALVGAGWFDFSDFTSHGAAFIYEWDGSAWIQTASLMPSAGVVGNTFGADVSLHKDLAVVSALHQDPGGAAYVFEWDGLTWNEIATLTPSDGETPDDFGVSVAIQGDRALIGAENNKVNGVFIQGAAYMFERDGDTWSETAKLTAKSGAEEDYFGTSVAMDGDLVVIGNRRSDEIGITDAGSAVVFEFDGTEWVEYTSLHENYSNMDNQFGRGVAISGNQVLVGAVRGDKVNEDETVITNTGTVHAFELDVDVSDVQPGVVTADPVDIDFGFVANETSSAPTPVTLTNTGTSSVDVTSVTFIGEDAAHFTHSITDPVTLAGGATSTVDVMYTPQLPASDVVTEGVLYRVNVGGGSLEDWVEDSEETPSPYVMPETTTIEATGDAPTLDASVPEDTPATIFSSKRLDANQGAPDMEWDFPVAAGGMYEIRMYFVEMSRCAVGNRLFDVEIEGVIVLDDFDIYSEAGSACDVGIMRSYTVLVEDNNIDINFPLANGKPSAVAGFEIITLTAPIINQNALLSIEHTGSNGAVFVNLTGETGSEQEGSTLSVSPDNITFDVTEEGAVSEAVTLTLSNDGTSPVDITSISLAGENDGDFTHTFTAPVTLIGGTTSTIDVAFAPQPETAAASTPMLEGESILFRVNAGGTLVGDWEEDTADSPSSYLLAGSAGIETDGPTPTLDATVPAGTPLELFTHKRIDANKPEPYMEWDFPVEAGSELVVNLFFVEMSRCSPGSRVFDVTIDGVVVLDDFDVYAEAGNACNQGTMRSVAVTAADDNLDIDFPLVNGKPAVVAAIEILGSGTPIDIDTRLADLVIEHTGSNPTLSVALSGEAIPSSDTTDTGDDNVGPVAAFTYEYTPGDISGNNALLVDVSADSDGVIATRVWDVAGTSAAEDSVSTVQDPDTPFTVTLTVTDDDGASSTVTETITLSQITITEIDGMVVFEAENYVTNEPYENHSWVEHTDVEGFSGAAAMQAQPNDGTTSNGIKSTHMTYEADFTTGGVYHLWARVYAETVNDNSLHLGDNGASTAVKANQNTIGEWSWTNVNTKNKTLTVDLTAGTNTIDVWMREDGLILDKLVVTTDELFIAEGLGPDESQRKGIAIASSAPDTQLAEKADEQDRLSKIAVSEDALPESFVLHANYPNPFNPVTTIEFELPEATAVRLDVFDMMGRRVATLVDQHLDAGRHQTRWDSRSDAGSPVASGVYIYRMQAGSFEQVEQMILMK